MFKTISFGEVLWDIFPEYKKPGGSPANLAYHLNCLGNKSLLVSRVGKDGYGDDLLSFLKTKGLAVDFIQKDRSNPTGIVSVHFKGDEPSYTIHEPSAWDFIETEENILIETENADAICFASLSQRNKQSANTLHAILKKAPSHCLKVFDLNLRPPFFDEKTIKNCIDLVDVIKLNEHELQKVSEWYNTSRPAELLIEHDPKKIVLITMGANGSAMHTSNGYFTFKAFPVTGRGDFVGVGDAFLACFIHLKLMNKPDEEILELSNKYAAYVASQKGAMPELPDGLTKMINT